MTERAVRTKLRAVLGAGAVAAVLAHVSCEPADVSLPTAEQVAAAYQYAGSLDAELSGNVAVVTVAQPYAQLQRGGTMWAKLGPYVVLFSEATRDLFVEHGGLAAVRVVTTTRGGQEVARATLPRDALNELTWRRALNIAGQARRDGTTRLTALEDLIEWGEEHTEFAYDPRYIRGR